MENVHRFEDHVFVREILLTKAKNDERKEKKNKSYDYILWMFLFRSQQFIW